MSEAQDHARDWLEQNLEFIKEEGAELLYVCPFPDCGDTRGHFSVNLEKRCCNCFHCNVGGSIVGVMADYTGKPRKTIYAEMFGSGPSFFAGDLSDLLAITAPPPPPVGPDGRPTKVLAAPTIPEVKGIAWETAFADPLDERNRAAEPARLYLFSRGFGPDYIAKYRIRFAPPTQAAPWGRFGGRVMIPATLRGEVIQFVARDYLGNQKPKYLNAIGPPGKEGRKPEVPMTSGECFFNWDLAMRYQTVVLCEGVTDAMKIGENAMATFGKKVSAGQAKLLRYAHVKKIIAFYDDDVPDAERDDLMQGLVALSSRYDIEFTRPGGKKDPGEMTPEEIKYALNRARPVTPFWRLEL